MGIIGTVAPDGTQYVVWNQGLNVTLAVSSDGGQTFAPSRPIFDVGAPGNNIVAADRTLDLTTMVVQRLQTAQ